MKQEKKVSIIVPVIKINDYIRESIPEILKSDYKNFEILIFPDQADKKHSWPKTKIIASDKVGPAEKRDLALKYASGEILAFLDDDAYPKSDWLSKMIKNFADQKVGAVGGPAITPKSDGVLQKVSGAVFESFVGGAFARNRYLSIGKRAECDDWPTVNLLVDRDVFKKVGGFDNSYWPGEDTKLCLDIINAGYKIIYDPSGIVFHHRRSDLLKHFKQIGNYALHRGFFAKKYPKTSLKIGYFAPTVFDLYLISFFIWPFVLGRYPFGMFYALPLAFYLFALLIDFVVISWRWRNPLIGFLTVPMIIGTHIWYGVRFVQGLIVRKLDQ